MEAILYNAVGQKIGVYPLTDTMGKIEINDNLAVGMYFLIMEIDGIRSEALPIQKGI